MITSFFPPRPWQIQTLQHLSPLPQSSQGDFACALEIWFFNLSTWAKVAGTQRDILGILSEEEKSRYQRFSCLNARKRYGVTRFLLRHLLGQRLDIDPGKLQFSQSASGKPALVGMMQRLEFNLSHSHDAVVIAIGARGWEGSQESPVGLAENISESSQEAEGFPSFLPLGIDIELLSRKVSVKAILQRYASPEEQKVFHAFSKISLPHQQSLAFLHSWTAKEAVLKCRGVGLAGYLERVLPQWERGCITSVMLDQQFYNLQFWSWQGWGGAVAWPGRQSVFVRYCIGVPDGLSI